MNQTYPDRHHPVFFLIDRLNAIGIRAEFARDDRTCGCWGMVFPDHNNRVLVWLIDNRLPHEAVREDPAAKTLLARGALVCHAQKRDAERVGGHWLPLAASPGFAPYFVEKRHDAAFVGYVRDSGRMQMLADLSAHFRVNICQGVFGEAAARAYSAAYCGVNIPSHVGSGYDYDINMRVFEIPACMTLLVTNNLPELEELGFVHRQTCLTYSSLFLIEDAVRAVMDMDYTAWNTIAEAGYQLIRDRHTYAHRARQVERWLHS